MSVSKASNLPKIRTEILWRTNASQLLCQQARTQLRAARLQSSTLPAPANATVLCARYCVTEISRILCI
jgi:hypothetical protein